MYQRTPLHTAAGEGYSYTVKYLIKNGADKSPKDDKGVSVLGYIDLKHNYVYGVSNTWV